MTDRLLQYLCDRVTRHGLVMVREDRLRRELGLSDVEIRAGLQKLEESALIEILSPLPFVVIRPRIWSGRRQKAPENGPVLPYSYKSYLSQSKQLNKSYSYNTDGATDQLLREILETLGESDPTPFRKAAEHYSAAAIRTTLERVRSAKSIRTNRTALFRFLLPKIARESSPSNN